MTEVFASKGPLAGRRVEIPEEDVAAATAPDGWAIKIEAGADLKIDVSAPYNPNWKIPGYGGQGEQLPTDPKPPTGENLPAGGAPPTGENLPAGGAPPTGGNLPAGEKPPTAGTLPTDPPTEPAPAPKPAPKSGKAKETDDASGGE